jgi:hypothetical protein
MASTGSRTMLGTSLKIITMDNAIRWIPLVNEKQLIDTITQLSWKLAEWEGLIKLSRVCRICQVSIIREGCTAERAGDLSAGFVVL